MLCLALHIYIYARGNYIGEGAKGARWAVVGGGGVVVGGVVVVVRWVECGGRQCSFQN